MTSAIAVHVRLARHRARCRCVRRILGGAAFTLLLTDWRAAQGLRLSAPLVPGGDVVEFQVASDGNRAVYRADQDVDGVFELYSVALDGGSLRKLNAAPVPGGGVGLDFVHDLRISTDGSRVLYLADQDEDDVFELFSVPIDGSLPPVQLNAALVAGGNVQFTPTFLSAKAFAPMTPDGSRVLYVADQEQDEVFELYCAFVDGSQPPVKLNATLVPGGDVLLSTPPFWGSGIFPQVSPDGTVVVYRADQEADDVFELYSVPLDGSRAPVKLNQPVGPDGDVLSALITPDGQWVLYFAKTDAPGSIDLYRVPLRGTPARTRRADRRDRVRLNVHLDPGEAVSGVTISRDGSRVLYEANPLGGFPFELLSVSLEGGPSTKLSKLSDGSVRTNVMSSVDGRVVYMAGDDDGVFLKLFSVPIDGSSERIQIDSVPDVGFELVPRADRAIYRHELAGYLELRSAPIDGSAAPVGLNPAGTSAGSFLIAPGGTYVVYSQAPELYAVDVEGLRPAWRLSGPFVPGGSVGYDFYRQGFSATATGRVLYLADQDTDEVFELFESFLERPHRRGP